MERIIYLNTTTEDLIPCRQKLYDLLCSVMDGWKCRWVEDTGYLNDEQNHELCKSWIKSCDLFVGVIGNFYGKHLDSASMSMQEAELAVADQNIRQSLLFLASDGYFIPANLRESDEKWRKQREFRLRLKNRNFTTFDSVDDLMQKVQRTFYKWQHSQFETSIYRLGAKTVGNSTEIYYALDNTPRRAFGPISLSSQDYLTALLLKTPQPLTEGENPMLSSEVAPFVPVIVEATKFLFSEVSKWIDHVRGQTLKSAISKADEQELDSALEIAGVNSVESEDDIRALVDKMDMPFAESNAQIVQLLVEQIKTHQINLMNSESKKAKYGIEVPNYVLVEIQGESESIVRKTAQLKAILRKTYKTM